MNHEKSIYKVPISGYYSIMANMTEYRPTGKMETVPNPDKKWYQFWKPATITRPKYETIEIPTARQIVYLEAGQKILASHGIVRV